MSALLVCVAALHGASRTPRCSSLPLWCGARSLCERRVWSARLSTQLPSVALLRRTTVPLQVPLRALLRLQHLPALRGEPVGRTEGGPLEEGGARGPAAHSVHICSCSDSRSEGARATDICTLCAAERSGGQCSRHTTESAE